MDVAVVPFAPEHLPLVERFSERYWTRPRNPEFYRWRYLDSRPFSRMFIGMRGGECVGVVFALRKDYLIAGQAQACLEVFDWHCLPEVKGTGLGIRLMRAMMRQPERVVAIGGTPDVLGALPAMGWQHLGVAHVFELPMSGDVLAAGLRRRTGVPAKVSRLPLEVVARLWFQPRRRDAVAGKAVVSPALNDGVDALYAAETGYDMVQRPSRAVMRWLGCDANNGLFEYLHFSVGNRLRGWAVTRLYDTNAGREGAIVEIFAPGADPGLYAWMVSEAATSLAAHGPRMIRARTSCPLLAAALFANRFRRAEFDVPVHTWPKGLPPPSRLHVTLNHTDEPIRPYKGGGDELTD